MAVISERSLHLMLCKTFEVYQFYVITHTHTQDVKDVDNIFDTPLPPTVENESLTAAHIFYKSEFFVSKN